MLFALQRISLSCVKFIRIQLIIRVPKNIKGGGANLQSKNIIAWIIDGIRYPLVVIIAVVVPLVISV